MWIAFYLPLLGFGEPPGCEDWWSLLVLHNSHLSWNCTSCQLPLLSWATSINLCEGVICLPSMTLDHFSYSSSLCLLFNPYGPVSPSLIVSTIFKSFNVIYQNSVLQTVLHVEYWICTLTSKKWIGPFNSITMTLQTPSTIFKRCFLSSLEIALFLKNQTSNSHPAHSLVLF